MIQRVLLTTGGTGGHIFPALAVAEELRRRNPGVDLLFMGSLYGPENALLLRPACLSLASPCEVSLAADWPASLPSAACPWPFPARWP